MGSYEKVIEKILLSRSDHNFDFKDICGILKFLGFEERIRGSHHIYSKEGIMEILNLQPDGSKAKVYQVKQVRKILVKYKLGV